ncbi:MAG: galactose-1-phosphate uridylyltransferase [Chloroflexota bacterium]
MTEKQTPHLGRWESRWHPLRQEWVIIAAHRQNRPWSGAEEATHVVDVPQYDPTCFLCPGNTRVSGEANPSFDGIHVFDNDHPCVGPSAPAPLLPPTGIYRNRPATGLARVICYSPRHDLTLARVEPHAVENLVGTWQREYRNLAARSEIKHVLIFENKGEAVGVSNPHPHGQIYATNFVFKTIEIEAKASNDHFIETGRPLFHDILDAEQQDGTRIVAENETAIAFIPYFGRYAYEVFVAPKATRPSVAELTSAEVVDFAAVLQEVLIRFDNLWEMPFPYVMPLHNAPTDGGDYRHFHFHIEFHPPLRKPNLLKFLAGPEIGGGNFLSDTVPSEKAAELRGVSDVHYAKRV